MSLKILPIMHDISCVQLALSELLVDNVEHPVAFGMLLNHIASLQKITEDLREKDIEGLER